MPYRVLVGREVETLMKCSDFTILITEDNLSERKIYQKALSSEGYQLILAESGSGMLAELKDKSVDMLITDLNMGPMSGFDALSIIKEKAPDLPIIVVSGHYQGMVDSFNGKKLKIETFFQKPLKMADLKKKIREVLKIEDL